MDALAQEAARARDATLHARIAIDVAAGNKLVYTIPKAAPGKEAGSFGLAAKDTDLVDLSEYEIRRLATMGRNDVELQRLEVAEASSMLVDTRTKQKASKPSRKPRSRHEAMPSLVRLRRSGRKRFQHRCWRQSGSWITRCRRQRAYKLRRREGFCANTCEGFGANTCEANDNVCDAHAYCQ